MQWYELAENPRAISEIYTVVPSLQAKRLKEVRFDEGSKITFVVDMMVFPENVPMRWKQRGYNVLLLQLDFWEIRSVQVTRWSRDNIVDIQVERMINGQIEVQAISPTCHVQLIAHDFVLALHKRVQASIDKR